MPRSVRPIQTLGYLVLPLAVLLAGCHMPPAPADWSPNQPRPADAPEARSDAGGEGHSHAEGEEHLGRLVAKAPADWVKEPPAGMNRVAQFRLPRAEGDPEDAELVVTFWPGGVGPVEENVRRWYGQFTQPDGRPTEQVAKRRDLTLAGMRATRVDLTGTYRGSAGPMMMAPAEPKPGWRMIAVLLTGPDGDYVFRLTGPRATVARWERSFDAYLASVKRH